MSGAPVAITGLGAVSGFGVGKGPLWRALLAGRTAIRAFDRFDAAPYRTKLAATLARGELPPGGSRRERLTLADRFALAAAREALDEAGLDPAGLQEAASRDALRVGVYFGSSTGGMLEAEEYFDAARAGRRRGRLALLAAQTPAGPAEAVARRYGARGPVVTVSSACSSGTLALGLALDALRAGEIDVALAGGADSFCRLTFAGFNSLRAVDAAPCRPFRAERQGMSLGEGAAVLVLERAEDARARGVAPLAALAGAGASCDAHHMTSPEPSGAGIGAAIVAALADAGIAANEVAFVNTHGTGTPLNDAAEGRGLAAIFGAGAMPVTSTKGAIGHYLGAAGAIEALVTALCLAEGLVHPTPGDALPDPALGVDLVVGAPRAVPGARHAISTNLAFGGANAACVLSTAETL